MRAIGALGMALFDWRVEGNFPDVAKVVIIVAPHTSNWDFLVGLFAALAIDLDARWFGKHTIFRAPLGWLLRWLGGIPVVRSGRHHVIDQWVMEFDRRDAVALALAPEGTRKRVREWRSGFWHLASGAHAPIVPVGLDYCRKAVVIGAPYWPTGDLAGDLVQLKTFFGSVVPRHPELFSVT